MSYKWNISENIVTTEPITINVTNPDTGEDAGYGFADYDDLNRQIDACIDSSAGTYAPKLGIEGNMPHQWPQQEVILLMALAAYRDNLAHGDLTSGDLADLPVTAPYNSGAFAMTNVDF